MTVAFTSFPGLPASVAAARRFVAGAIRLYPQSSAPDDVVDRAALLTSELATNAIRHTRSGDPGETFTVRVSVDSSGAWTEVRTRAPRLRQALPHVAAPEDPFAEHGRGLFLVDQLATKWGSLAPWQHPFPAFLSSAGTTADPPSRLPGQGRGRSFPGPAPLSDACFSTQKAATRMDDDTADGFVTLYAGPLDGLALTRTELASLVQDYGTERFLFLTHHGASGLYQQTADRWVYAVPGLLNHNDNTQGDTREEAP